MNLKDLKNPFAADDIEWRIQQSGLKGTKPAKPWGLVLAYVTNRAIMDRLDDVVGPENWSNEYKAGPDGGVLCGLSINISGEWVTKWDGAENTQVESIKGGLSSAMKRAAVHWGIGRYLYGLSAGWAIFSEQGANKSKIGGEKWFKWDPPGLPSWALPEGTEPPQKKTQAKARPQNTKKPPTDAIPIQPDQSAILNGKMTDKKMNQADRNDFKDAVLSMSTKKIPTEEWADDFIKNFDNYHELWLDSRAIGGVS